MTMEKPFHRFKLLLCSFCASPSLTGRHYNDKILYPQILYYYIFPTLIQVTDDSSLTIHLPSNHHLLCLFLFFILLIKKLIEDKNPTQISTVFVGVSSSLKPSQTSPQPVIPHYYYDFMMTRRSTHVKPRGLIFCVFYDLKSRNKFLLYQWRRDGITYDFCSQILSPKNSKLL